MSAILKKFKKVGPQSAMFNKKIQKLIEAAAVEQYEQHKQWAPRSTQLSD